MQIRQLQINYDQLQDRLVLRMATTADEEYRLWITRLFLKKIWPVLANSRRRQAEARALATDDDAACVKAADEPAENDKFSQPFRDENATYPLGATPFLISEVDFDTLQDHSLRLTFREGRERRLSLTLTQELLEAFCAMLRATASKAAWGLDLDYDSPPPAPAPTLAPPTSRLH